MGVGGDSVNDLEHGWRDGRGDPLPPPARVTLQMGIWLLCCKRGFEEQTAEKSSVPKRRTKKLFVPAREPDGNTQKSVYQSPRAG